MAVVFKLSLWGHSSVMTLPWQISILQLTTAAGYRQVLHTRGHPPSNPPHNVRESDTSSRPHLLKGSVSGSLSERTCLSLVARRALMSLSRLSPSHCFNSSNPSIMSVPRLGAVAAKPLLLPWVLITDGLCFSVSPDPLVVFDECFPEGRIRWIISYGASASTID